MFSTFTTISASIFLEGIFFLLIGILISSLIEEFISEDTLRKLIPKNKILGLLVASSLGVIFPICECGIVPVVRRLLKKGVPLHLCVTLLFSSPIVNIVVTISTFFAFQNYFYVVILRLLGGFLISFTTGLLVSFKDSENLILLDNSNIQHCSCTTESCHGTKRPFNRISRIGSHTVLEFFDTGKFFIMGILITGLIQSVIPNSIFKSIGSNYPLGNIFMLIYPYFLSICSNTDAFIARSFMEQFSISAILGFMIFGAMFDLKTTIMLKKVFNIKFIIYLFLVIFSLTIIFTTLIQFLVLGGVQ
ncbi:MAG: permease [Spirochaetales bacterium]|nr:permease [Spirochaetales bacterium]